MLNQPHTIIDYANAAFNQQTIRGPRYVKPDVQGAYDAFIAFQTSPNDMETLINFRNEAKKCEENGRVGFDKLVKRLDGKIKLAQTSTSSRSSSSRKPGNS